MKKISLLDLDKSVVKYRIDRFPDGEVQFLFTEELNRKDEYEVDCRITNAEDLFILLQVGDILDRQGIVWNLHIRYLMGMRMDRVMSFERPFTLKIVGKMISDLGYDKCLIDTPHSDRTLKEVRNSYVFDVSPLKWYKINKPEAMLVFPDKGALERYNLPKETKVVYFDKERDIETGKIKSFVLHDLEGTVVLPNEYIFFDDLCDAGGTFLGELSVLKEKYPEAKYGIRVTHLVNEKGLDNLCQNFDYVYVTDSYREWKSVADEKGYTNLIIDKM